MFCQVVVKDADTGANCTLRSIGSTGSGSVQALYQLANAPLQLSPPICQIGDLRVHWL